MSKKEISRMHQVLWRAEKDEDCTCDTEEIEPHTCPFQEEVIGNLSVHAVSIVKINARRISKGERCLILLHR
jgi:hypothetical protein